MSFDSDFKAETIEMMVWIFGIDELSATQLWSTSYLLVKGTDKYLKGTPQETLQVKHSLIRQLCINMLEYRSDTFTKLFLKK